VKKAPERSFFCFRDQGPRTTLCLSTGERSSLAALEQIFHIRYHLSGCLAGQWGRLRWQESKREEVLFGFAAILLKGRNSTSHRPDDTELQSCVTERVKGVFA
jgi:hypothetical protein